MKFIFFALALFTSQFSFSQSYMIFDNGSILTLDKFGFIYDLGNYVYPQKVTLTSGRYFIEENRILNTISEEGLLFKKFEVLPDHYLGTGDSYFISTNGDLYTIDNNGIASVTNNERFKFAKKFGGNFFFLPSELNENELQLYVINSQGQLIEEENLLFLDEAIVDVGGSYFMTNKGELYSVGFNGEVNLNNSFRVGILSKKGGRFFVDSSGFLFSLNQAGQVVLPSIPHGLKTQMISRIGWNYFIDSSARLFVIDQDGNIIQKESIDQNLRYLRFVSH
jgi:hypothetical protein